MIILMKVKNAEGIVVDTGPNQGDGTQTSTGPAHQGDCALASRRTRPSGDEPRSGLKSAGLYAEH